MRIVHLSHSENNGGAARAAWRLHQSLVRTGVDSTMFVQHAGTSDPRVTPFRPAGSPLAATMRTLRRVRLRRVVERATRGRDGTFEHFRLDREEFGAQVLPAVPPADVFNFHYISGLIDYAAVIPALARGAPICWTLHDMAPMTGGCPYAYDCDRFTRQCGDCPQLGARGADDLSHQVWRRKHAVFSAIAPERLHIVGPSNWMVAEAQRSALLGRFPATVIPNGVDTQTFSRLPTARRLLDDFGISPRATVVLFLADYLGNRRKGFASLDAALAALPRKTDVALLSLGRDSPQLRSDLPHVHLGTMHDDRLIAMVYSMADVYVIPSLQDNLPNTVLEAMACGTPAIGFRVGGVPDMITHGENGLLVPPGDIAGLATAIDALVTDEPRRGHMGRAARATIEQRFTLSLQAERYLALYRSLRPSI